MHPGTRHSWGSRLRVQLLPSFFQIPKLWKVFFVAKVLEFDAEVEYQKTVIDKGLIMSGRLTKR